MVLVKSLAIIFTLLVSVVNAHSFSVCPGYTDHFHVSQVDMTPEKPQANKPFSLKVKFKPDTTYESPIEVDVSVKVFGVRVFQYKLDACSTEASGFVSCPIKAGVEQTLEASTVLPSEVPRDIEANVQILISHAASPATCIIVTVDTANLGEENGFVEYFTNTYPKIAEEKSGNGLRVGASNEEEPKKMMSHHEQSMRFLYKKWLEEFHQVAEIEEWYPVHDKASKQTFEERFTIFAKNFIDIVLHNKQFKEGKTTYAKKMNQFGHLHPTEFRAAYLSGYRRDAKKRSFFSELAKLFGKAPIKLIPNSPSAELGKVFDNMEDAIKADQIPESIDWVEKGAVNPVKNQGSCGSCWAFSAIAALESAYFLKYGELKSFSEQELVSCEEDCYGCNGGLMNNAFDWIKEHGGVCTDTEYSYASGTSGSSGFCRLSSCTPDPKSAVKSFVEVEHSEEALKQAVAQQPVSVAIEADEYAFQFYSHGVLTGTCGDKIDHGVVAVGYGNLDGTDFWKVRNSWGASWGMQGYILIQRGKNVPTGDGECGIVLDPVYPVL